MANEKVNMAMERLEQGLRRLVEQEDWRTFLRFQAAFHSYSFGNQLLIWAQCLHASRVAGFKQWLKLGRHVKKGEKGIMILAPRFGKKTEEVNHSVLKGGACESKGRPRMAR